MKTVQAGTRRRSPTWWWAVGLVVTIAIPAVAGEPTALPGEDAICAGLSGEDAYWCRQACKWPGAMEEQTGQCLLVLRFGAAGAKTYLAVLNGGGDVEQAAVARGMALEEARRLMLFLDFHEMVRHAWVPERGLTSAEQAELDVAEEANREAARLGNAGRSIEALEKAQNGWAVHEKIMGPEHPYTLFCLTNLAKLLEMAGDFAGAAPLSRRAWETLGRVLGAEHPRTLVSMINLAFLQQKTGDYADAEKLNRQALEVAVRVLGPEHPTTLGTMNNLALLLLEVGEYASAKSLFHGALEAERRVLGPEHATTLIGLNNLALSHARAGEYTVAESLYRQALEAQERVLGSEHPNTLMCLHNLALLLYETGDYSGAEPLFRRALEAQEKVLGLEHPDRQRCLHNLALLLYETGDHAGAESLFRQALNASERVLGPAHPDTLAIITHLARLLRFVGDFAGAEPLVLRLVEAYEYELFSGHPISMGIMNVLAGVLVEAGYHADAENLLRRALEDSERLLGAENPQTLAILGNLAALKGVVGDHVGAESLLRRLLEAQERVMGPEHSDTLTTLMQLAAMKWVQDGGLPAAKALAIRAIQGFRDHFGRNMDVARTDQSMRSFLDTVRGIYHMFLEMFSDLGDEREVFEQVLSWQGAATTTAMLVNDLRRAERNAPAAQKELFVRYREASRERIRLLMEPVKDETAFSERARGLQALDDEAARLEQELSAVNADFRRRRAIVEATREGVCASLKTVNATMVLYVWYLRLDPKAQNDPSTPTDERFSRQYLGLVLKPESCEVNRLDLGDAAFIDAVVETYRTAIERMQGCIQARTLPPDSVGHVCEEELAAVDAAALAVREKVWDPVAGALPASSRIYVVPDGSLVDVPFGSLPTGTLPDGKTKYLIEDRDLAYLPSPRDAMWLGQSQETGGEGALVMGEVDYTTAEAMPQALSESARCGRLGCEWGRGSMVAKAGASRQEGLRSTEGCGWAERTWGAGVGKEAPDVAEALGRNLGGGALLTTHWRATEGLLRQEMPGKRILHLSSHGFYSTWEQCRKKEADEGRRRLLRMAPKRMEAVGEEKWESDPLTLTGLVLAGANAGAMGTDREDPASDGVLSGREIADLDLTTTDVVVLAACETGRGDRTWGEGALGLGKAFLVAGARQVVMALWQVPDFHTAALFRNFYERITEADREPVPSAVVTKTGSASRAPSVKPERPTDASPRASSDPVTALRRAQLTLLNDARYRLGLPHSSYLWGAFVPVVRGN